MYCWDEKNISTALNLLQCLEYQRISWMTDKLHWFLKGMSTNYTLELPSMKKHRHWKLLTCPYQHSSPIRAGFRHILEAHLPQAENSKGLPMQGELVSRPCVGGKQLALNCHEKYPQVPNPSVVPRRLLEGHINWPQDRWTACNRKEVAVNSMTPPNWADAAANFICHLHPNNNINSIVEVQSRNTKSNPS